ncbi:hypothetical protein Moror_8758 [Moniliophthora roreri MCA 2997]|uniref:Uncharacterized protein n=1 Tax=Moniliophthora roreri (strain MCA 2997) TaxID=1381753 RepID=V2WT23_MONRO|nr:hypothetical protein Moror_8758 [Moniliophthora roreri MCA 2997]
MPPRKEAQIDQDIAKAEECWCGLQDQSILNPGRRAIPPLTQASRRELLTHLLLPSPTNQPLTETPKEYPETKRTLTPLSILIGSEKTKNEEEPLHSVSENPKLNISDISSISVEESDLFQCLLHALKNSPRSTKKPQLEEMAEDKKPSESRPKSDPVAEETMISAMVLVQMVMAEKEIKAALLRAFTGNRKDAKKFL